MYGWVGGHNDWKLFQIKKWKSGNSPNYLTTTLPDGYFFILFSKPHILTTFEAKWPYGNVFKMLLICILGKSKYLCQNPSIADRYTDTDMVDDDIQ